MNITPHQQFIARYRTLDDKYGKEIVKMIESTNTINYFDIASANVSFDILMKIIEALKSNTSIQYLNLISHQQNVEMLNAIIDMLAVNPRIKEIKLFTWGIDTEEDELIEQIYGIIEMNKNGRSLIKKYRT